MQESIPLARYVVMARRQVLVRANARPCKVRVHLVGLGTGRQVCVIPVIRDTSPQMDSNVQDVREVTTRPRGIVPSVASVHLGGME